jgi:four helix bundle protein
MAGARDFTELAAWQLAHELRGCVLTLVERPLVKRSGRFREQICDAASSAPRNIAEGYGRFRPREFAQFVRVAKASEHEVHDCLLEARQRRFINESECSEYSALARRAIAAATGLVRYLERAAESGPFWRDTSSDPPDP